jgi:hypothetical protein
MTIASEAGSGTERMLKLSTKEVIPVRRCDRLHREPCGDHGRTTEANGLGLDQDIVEIVLRLVHLEIRNHFEAVVGPGQRRRKGMSETIFASALALR